MMKAEAVESSTLTKNLPKGWRWARLRDLCTEDRNIIEPDSSAALKRPYLGLEHVESNSGRIVLSPSEIVSNGGRSTTFAFDERHVLYGKLRPYLNKVALPDFSGRCTTELIPLLPKEGVDRSFLAWVLRRRETVDAAMRESTGSRMPRADMNVLFALEIPVPPLAEQQRMVTILDEQMAVVEKSKAALETQLEAAKALPATYLRAMLAGPESKNWPHKLLGDLVNNFDGKRIPIKLDERRGRKGQYPYYGASGIIDYVDEYLFDGDYLLISEDGANLVMRSSPIAFKAEGKFWVNNHAHVVQPREGILLDFLIYFLAITDLKPFLSGAAQPKLTQEDMNSIPISVPPLSDQEQILAKFTQKMLPAEQIRKALEDQLDALIELPAAILKQAFNGGIVSNLP